MTNTVISYPTPPYSNPPIQPQFYQPQVGIILAISLGLNTTVMTLFPNQYVVGQQVRFVMTTDSGTRQLNGLTGYIIQIITPSQFVVSIDSTQMTPFVTPTGANSCQVLAIGDINQGDINAQGNLNTGTTIPGSFHNVS